MKSGNILADWVGDVSSYEIPSMEILAETMKELNMATTFYAVLIGFNQFTDEEHLSSFQFAEKDATDLYDVLVDSKIGNHPANTIALITGNDLRLPINNPDVTAKIAPLVKGEVPPHQLTTEQIKKILTGYAVETAGPDDTVLIYYAGHGFIAGDDRKVFLGTPDISILNIFEAPEVGLQMEYLHEEIFKKSRAKFIVFLMDCCHSGPFCSSLDEPLQEKLLDENEVFGGTHGRIAFVSVRPGKASRESQGFHNGIFTSFLLKGLQGEAAEPDSGTVTIESLVDYVKNKAPSKYAPERYGKRAAIVLSMPEILSEDIQKVAYKAHDYIALPNVLPKTPKVISLGNPLQNYITYIDQVIDCLEPIRSDGSAEDLGRNILAAIRCSLASELVFIQRVTIDKSVIYKFQSDFEAPGRKLESYRNSVMSAVYPWLISPKKKLLPKRYGFYKPFEDHQDAGRYIIAIPLRIEFPREFLILCGVKNDCLQYGEVLGRSLISIYQSTNELTSFAKKKIEAGLLDDIRRDFGHVPYEIYARRLKSFRERLESIIFYFEPVISLGKKSIEIDSWEALARDPETDRAPVDLFKAAELWGTEFTTELDLYCLENAIATYRKNWKKQQGISRYDPLAVNAYPETLLRKNYKNKLMELIQKKELIRGHKLTIEISEKRPLPDSKEPIEGEISRPIDDFMNIIHECSSELSVRFAIDDFGVEHSSIDRLARLELDHVKIDRDILHHPHPECTIEYVKHIVDKSHFHPTKIVVEGFDGDSRISLAALYQLGIRFVQGHLIRKASPEVADLGSDREEFLLREVNK